MKVLNYDAVVCGGGTAGSAAAISIARYGYKVLLLEESNCLGGTSTAGGVNEWYASLDGLGNIFNEIRHAMAEAGAKFGRFFNSEYLKICWQEIAERSGVDILFHSQVYEARMSEGRVQAVIFTSCSNSFEVRARFFLDCTGEGDLSYLAGAECIKGDKNGKNMMHVTLTFLLHNAGKVASGKVPMGLPRIETDDQLPGLHACFRLPDDRVYCNMTKVIGVDPTDPFSLSKAEREARRQVFQIVDYLQRTRFPKYSLCNTGARIGIREGRRVICDYILTEQDILGEHFRKNCEDGIAVATCHIDHLDPTAQGGGGRREGVEPYQIPLRCMLVKGFSNLLVAGKCISGDQVAMASYRMIPTCCAMGQSAGTAVGLAMKDEKDDVRSLDFGMIRDALTQSGLELDPRKHKPFFGWSKADRGVYKLNDDA